MKGPFQIPAHLDGYKSLVSGGIKFSFTTQENINPDQLLQVMRFLNKLGWLTFNVDIIEAEDILKLKEIKIDRSKYDKGKTHSQRLRSVLFLFNEKLGNSKESFGEFYEEKMEMLINHFKEKLNEL